MRTYVLFIVLGLCVAFAQAANSSEPVSPMISENSPLSWNYLSGAADQVPFPVNDTRDPNHRYTKHLPSEVTCLKLRTYLMAREGSDTDLTRMVGYRTCTRSAKFDLRLSYTPAQPAEQ